MLSIVMRGVGGVGMRDDEQANEDEENHALAVGDSEDGDAQASEEDEDPDRTKDERHSSSGQYFTVEQINRRRRGLIKAMDAFQELLTRLAAEPALVLSRLAAQTAFMIQLMMLACTFDHKLREEDSVRLMVLFPRHDSERERSFALRVARMLKAIWVGKNSIARNILVDARHRS